MRQNIKQARHGTRESTHQESQEESIHQGHMKTRPMYMVHPIPGLRPPNLHAMHYSFDKRVTNCNIPVATFLLVIPMALYHSL